MMIEGVKTVNPINIIKSNSPKIFAYSSFTAPEFMLSGECTCALELALHQQLCMGSGNPRPPTETAAEWQHAL